MEVLCLNRLVSEKKQENIFVPTPLRNFIAPELAKRSRQKKWMFYAAAVLAFMERKPAERDARIGKIASADSGEGYDGLIEEAKRAGNTIVVKSTELAAIDLVHHDKPETKRRRPRRDGSKDSLGEKSK